MKREVSREKVLPAFLIGIGDLELLWGRLLDLFDRPEEVNCTLDITLPSESLEFNSVAELKSYSALQGRVTNFKFWLSQDGRRVSLRSSSFIGSRPIVSASADSEAWCAGAIETVYSLLQANKIWYSWFVSAPIGWIFIVIANIPNIALLVLPKGESFDKAASVAWVTVTIVCGFLYLVRAKLLPSSVLVITHEEGFIRRHIGELSLLMAIISVILTVVGWFLGR